MQVDRSGRIWAMRHDEVMITEAAQQRKAMREAQAVDGMALEGSDFARVVDGVAVVPVRGLLMREQSFFFWSYEEILRDVELAQQDPRVRSILLHVDSGGGMVAGCQDCAAAIRASGPKPIEAFVGGTAASAAYWIAAAADRITLGSGAVVGSVGAVIEYVDMEPVFEAMGAKVVRVVAEQSPNKRLDPMSEEGRAEMQALVDAAGADFVTALADLRGVSEAQIMARFGQGSIFDRSEALARGMADASGTLPLLIADMAADGLRPDETPNRAGLAACVIETADPAAAAQETDPMEWENLTLAALREHRADLVSEIEGEASAAAKTAQADASAEAVKEAVAAERARISAIDDIAMDAHADLTAKAKAEGWTAEALALEVVKAEKAAGASELAAMRDADDVAAVKPMKAQTTGTDPDASPEEQAQAAWDKDSGLRAEFNNNFDAFAAFHKAASAGRVKIHTAA